MLMQLETLNIEAFTEFVCPGKQENKMIMPAPYETGDAFII